jgi:hypothetical protein
VGTRAGEQTGSPRGDELLDLRGAGEAGGYATVTARDEDGGLQIHAFEEDAEEGLGVE